MHHLDFSNRGQNWSNFYSRNEYLQPVDGKKVSSDAVGFSSNFLSIEGDRNYFYIFIQSKETLIHIKSKKLEETTDEQEIKLDFDSILLFSFISFHQYPYCLGTLFFKEFDSDEKMHSLLDYLRKVLLFIIKRIR